MRASMPASASSARSTARHVVTVEHLRGADGALHPVQQAMVDFHGTNAASARRASSCRSMACGCATPSRRDAAIEKALQGNLCRCTGYAADHRARRRRSRAMATAASDPLVARAQGDHRRGSRRCTTARASRSATGKRPADRAGQRSTISPRSTQPSPSATLVAGSTDVGLWVTKFMRDIGPVIFIGDLDGAAARSPKTTAASRSAPASPIPRRCAALGQAFPAARPTVGPHRRRAGAQHGHDRRQHRQRLADRRHAAAADRARRARSRCARAAQRRDVKLEDFFIAYGKQDRQPGEFVESVHVPVPADGRAVRRLQDHQAPRRGHLGAAAARSGCSSTTTARSAWSRIAFGGMAATPKRASAVEAALLGKPWTEATVEAAMAAFAEDFSRSPTCGPRPNTGCWRRRTCCGGSSRNHRHQGADPGCAGTRRHDEQARTPNLKAAKIAGGVATDQRHDSAHKHVSGTAVYIDDMPEPAGTLHAYLGLVDRAHAEIVVDRSRRGARRAGRRRRADGRRHAGRERHVSSSAQHDEPVFADGKVQFCGQPIFCGDRRDARAGAARGAAGQDRISTTCRTSPMSRGARAGRRQAGHRRR